MVVEKLIAEKYILFTYIDGVENTSKQYKFPSQGRISVSALLKECYARLPQLEECFAAQRVLRKGLPLQPGIFLQIFNDQKFLLKFRKEIIDRDLFSPLSLHLSLEFPP